MKVNKYGLHRRIDDAIKRLIRQKSGFGCIFCGSWIYQYAHIEPEFANAKVHDPEKICLLCGTHHQKVTLGRLSKKQVFDQYQHPIALSRGFASDYLDLRSRFYVALGRVFFVETGKLLIIDGVDLLSVSQPTPDEPMKLNAKFFDNQGNLLLSVTDNEMIGYTKNWDIEQKGAQTIIRRKRGDIVLQMNIIPPDVIEIERINMVYGSAEIYTDAKTGRICIRSKNGAVVDLFKGQIITEGLTIMDMGVTFDKANMVGVHEGLEFDKMDYRDFIDNGSVHSEPKKTTILKKSYIDKSSLWVI